MPSISFNVTQSDALLGTYVTAGTPLIIDITNPLIGASYIALETIPDNNGFYTVDTPKNLSGSISTDAGVINTVKDDYKMAAVVAQGVSQLTFTPSVNIGGTTLKVRGITGNFSESLNAYIISLVNAYTSRVTSDGGTVEGEQCLINGLSTFNTI